MDRHAAARRADGDPVTPQRRASGGREGRGLLLALLAVAIPLLIGQQVPVRVAQDLGAPGRLGNITGLGPDPEQSPEGPFRWSGRRVTMALPPLGYPLVAHLRVKGERPAGQPPVQLGAAAGGRSLGVQTLPGATKDLDYTLPATAMFSVNPQLTLTATVFQPPGEQRTLGAVFFRVETASGPGPSLPAPWPGGLLLLSGALLYTLLRAAGGRIGPALLVTLAWGLVLGGLNALARPGLIYYCAYLVVPPLAALLLLPWLRSLRTRRPGGPPPQPADPPVLTTRPGPLAAAVVTGALLVFAWHLVAPHVPSGSGPRDNLTWGVAFYGTLPWPLQALGVAAVIAAIAWAARAPLPRPAPDPLPAPLAPGEALPPAPAARPLPDNRNLRFALPAPRPIWLVAGLGVVLGLLFPVQYSEGDSNEFDKKIPPGELWRERELLDFYLKARLWRLLAAWLPRPSQVYALVAAVGGGVYLGGAWLLGRALGRTRADSWVIVAALAAVGNILLFFGYVESYALVQVLSLFVLWACWQYAAGRVPFGSVGVLAMLAPFFHGQALWWAPMVAAAWLVRAGQLPRATRWRTALVEGAQGVAAGLAVVLIVVAVVFLDGYGLGTVGGRVAGLGGGDGHTLIQLFTTETSAEHYPFFSWPALGAFTQEQLLTAPLALLTIGLMVVLAGRGVRRLATAVPSFRVLAVGAAAMFCFSLTWNPDAGPRLDWDLLSISALPLTLVAVYLLLALPPGRARHLALTAYLSVSAVHAAAWVALHTLGLHA